MDERPRLPIISVDDLPATQRFYERLGFSQIYQFPPEGEPGFVTMARGSVSIIWPEVEVNPVLHRLWLGHRDEEEAGQSIRSRSNLELVWFVVYDNPSQRLPPQRPSVPGLRASTIVWSHSRLTGRSSELRRRAELLRQRQPLALASDERVHEQP